jgi:hypothetical protein
MHILVCAITSHVCALCNDNNNHNIRDRYEWWGCPGAHLNWYIYIIPPPGFTNDIIIIIIIIIICFIFSRKKFNINIYVCVSTWWLYVHTFMYKIKMYSCRYIMCRRTCIRAINNFWDFPEPRKTRPDQSPRRCTEQSGRGNLYSVRFPKKKKKKKNEMKQNK